MRQARLGENLVEGDDPTLVDRRPLDGKPVGSGKPGPWFVRMHAAFVDFTRELAGTPAL